MSHIKTQDKRFLCPMFRKGYSDYKRFGENGLADEMPLEYYNGVQAAAWEDVPDEYLEDHSHD